MELHKELSFDKNKYKISLSDNYLEYFAKAKEFVLDNYSEDYNRIANTKFEEITPEFFFSEYCWVVYTSGFNAKIVSKLFPALQEIYAPLVGVFKTFRSDVNTNEIETKALGIINNKRKVKSIISVAVNSGKEINQLGWLKYKETKLNSPDKLQKLPFIGPITCYHLARNIGLLDFMKPDIHMERVAKHWNFDNSLEMCRDIQNTYDLPLGLIDLIMWYSLSTFGSKIKKEIK